MVGGGGTSFLTNTRCGVVANSLTRVPNMDGWKMACGSVFDACWRYLRGAKGGKRQDKTGRGRKL